MIIRSNVHTHTDFCDGSDSMEDMVRAAIACGMDTLGISFHSFTPFDTSYCIRDYPAYMRELSRLRKKYAGSICLLGGVELDLYGQSAAGVRLCDRFGALLKAGWQLLPDRSLPRKLLYCRARSIRRRFLCRRRALL